MTQDKNFYTLHKKSIILYGILFLFMIGSITGGALYVQFLFQGLPSLSVLDTFEPNQTTQIYTVNGELVREIFYKEKRIIVPIDRIPADMINSFIATEDHRFYTHWGVDSYRFFGALWELIKNMGYVQGFSTATMQLSRQLYLNREKKISRKLREIILAIQIEKRYSKREILEMHLNKEYFGHGAHGIYQAASIYYSKEVDDLALEECALLTAQLNGPTRFSPLLHPDRALARRNLVLRNMLRHGYISQQQYLEASNKPIKVTVRLNQQLEEVTSLKAPYFTEHVRLLLDDMQEQYNFDLYRDGLKVYTTLDLRAQREAEKALQEQLELQQRIIDIRMRNRNERILLLEKLGYEKDKTPELLMNTVFMDSLIQDIGVVQGAFVAMDLSNGHIRALIGGKDFNKYKFNIATQAERQAGSIFKPFIYTVAIDNGYPVTTTLLNQPVVIIAEDGKRWSPMNYDRTTGGPVTLREALQRSLNLISVRMIQELVPASEIVKVAHRMGLTSYIPAVDALALGTVDVKLLEMVSAYSAFPNQGLKVEPVFITKIIDSNGEIKYEHQHPVKGEVLNEETAYILTDLMRSVVLHGSGRYAGITYGFRRPAGGKTGTTDDFSNAWFIGFSKQIVAGTWIGLDRPILSLGPRQSGQVVAVPVWAKFMKAYHDTLGLEVLDFERPETIIELRICNETKKLANRYCPDVTTEIFNAKTKPTEYCDKHLFRRREGIR
ncbi:penicillin-binding protein 1A [candidate division KSB1 bacterium]